MNSLSEDIIYENGVITKPWGNNDVDPKGVGHHYFSLMKKHQDKIFQIDTITGEEETYGTVLERCVRTALKMRSLGVKPGDVVTTISLNSLNSCVPSISCLFLGGVVTNLDPFAGSNQASHILNELEPKLVFVEESSVGYIEKIFETIGKSFQIVVLGTTERYASFAEFLEPSPDESTFVPEDVDVSSTAVILYSSGTTGLPKGICVSHSAHLKQARLAAELESTYDRILLFARLSWATSVIYLGASIFRGDSRLVVPKFDADTVWDVIKRFKPKIVVAANFQIAQMCSANDVVRDVDSVETVIVGGSVVFEQQLQLYRKTFSKATIKICIGLTESGIVTYSQTHTKAQLDVWNKKILTVGTVMNEISYKVVDVHTRQNLGPNQHGELLLKSDFFMTRYHKRDDSETWDADRWLRTGDIVYYDEDFYFYYVERLKQMIKYRGMYVMPACLEGVLLKHPNVKNACVVKVFHETDGEHPMAFVELRDFTRSNEIEGELHQLVADHLDDEYKLRGGLKIVRKFPVTASGKMDVSELKKMTNTT